jgi:hypothetical protein
VPNPVRRGSHGGRRWAGAGGGHGEREEQAASVPPPSRRWGGCGEGGGSKAPEIDGEDERHPSASVGDRIDGERTSDPEMGETERITVGSWLMAGTGLSREKILLARWWWLVCSERKVLLTGS